jgi:ABC-type Fe3+/spermidine/putrescine transport system ATPase subunit
MQHREAVERIIEFVELEGVRYTQAGALPFGTQKIVGLARALALEPSALLLDEPSAGVSRDERDDLHQSKFACPTAMPTVVRASRFTASGSARSFAIITKGCGKHAHVPDIYQTHRHRYLSSFEESDSRAFIGKGDHESRAAGGALADRNLGANSVSYFFDDR